MSGSDPLSEVEELFDALSSSTDDPSPPTDVVDAGDRFEVRIDLPGYADLDLRLDDDQTLRLDAERDTAVEGEALTRERRREMVTRTVRLPAPVDPDATEASYDDGVLAVVLPKRRDDEGTSIPVE
jgi:HSP20 family protein